MDLGQSPRLVDHSIDIITITICAAICNAATIREDNSYRERVMFREE